ncbi:ferric reductase, partial [Streptomyces sp. SID14478]|nr:ferric reductase [Streptomyces sp. SID14478]
MSIEAVESELPHYPALSAYRRQTEGPAQAPPIPPIPRRAPRVRPAAPARITP